ncbi:methyl-accepting chemotaxis protein [Fulvimarina sp. MAC8]|uniref:methyl-accepting chemotaxis protein n=1 Tax=Fulvimarina sp. MAC8 TaxID=3162874 RepID=UPI0032F03D5F
MRLKDIPVGLRLLATLVLPVALLLIVAQSEVRSSWAGYQQMNSVRDATAELEIIGKLIHTLQVERGTTAGFIGSRGASMGEAMQKARQATNAVHAEFLTTDHVIVRIGDEKAPRLMAKIEPMLRDEISQIRERIDAFSLTGKEAFGFYTNLVSGLSGLAVSFYQGVDEPELDTSLTNYSLLLMAKEFAGQERGLGAGIIEAGRFTRESYFRMAELSGRQAGLLELYELGIDPKTAEDVSARLGNVTPQVNGLRERLLENGLGADLSSLNGKDWFEQTTARIDVIHALGEETIVRIVAKAVAMGNASYSAFVQLAIIVALTSIAVAVLTFVLARSITNPLQTLTGCMRALLQGNTSMDGVDVTRKDQIGEMARAVQGFVVQTEERVVREREEEATRVREREQLRSATEAERAETQAASMLAVNELGTALQHLAKGNLSYRIETKFAELFEPLRVNFNRSLASLDSALAVVVDVSQSLRGNTDELKTAADDLSRRTEQQAASLEETAAALSEVSDTVNESSQRAERVGAIVAKTADYTQDSNEIVASTVAAIRAIADSSQEVARFVTVIDEIAFQTNLLALNAGVEAARAGEFGKGFAVVASEVRELSQRSANAAKEIKELIGRSEEEVENGVKMSEKTNAALKGILEQIGSVKTEMGAIVSAARSQSTALTEINQAIREMDQVTQQNAAMVEESTAASMSIAEQAWILSDKVAGFELSKKTTQAKRLAYAA